MRRNEVYQYNRVAIILSVIPNNITRQQSDCFRKQNSIEFREVKLTQARESMQEFAASNANSRYNGFSDSVSIEQTNGDEENSDPNKFSIKVESAATGAMKAKLKDRRSLMKKQGSSRRRRRSSARFLKIVPNDDDDECGDKEGATYDGISMTNLGEVYRNAIRMNAENRINASNSWNLNLIDHLDRFVTTERHGTGAAGGQNHGSLAGNTFAQTNDPTIMESTMNSVSGVNFTKASCTLDASVKIYSYRVDDVHLTSYKVLANLNRTDSNANDNRKKKKSSSDENSDLSTDSDGEDSSSGTKSRSNTNAVDTLEQNTGKFEAAHQYYPCGIRKKSSHSTSLFIQFCQTNP